MLASKTIDIQLAEGEKIYFASDFHLGSPNYENSRVRERDIVSWLDQIQTDADTIFLVGDVFDYWFEYKHVVPKGAVRLLGKLAELVDKGITIYYFTGNHDMWMRDYFEKEIGVKMYRKPVRFDITNSTGEKHSIYVAHGDGLGPGDHIYKLLKVLFESTLARFFFRQVHPDFASWIAHAWSGQSRASNDKKEEFYFKGEDQEWLFLFCKEIEAKLHHDYYLFGHRHLPLDLEVGANSRYINLGEWFTKGSQQPFAVFDGSKLQLHQNKQK